MMSRPADKRIILMRHSAEVDSRRAAHRLRAPGVRRTERGSGLARPRMRVGAVTMGMCGSLRWSTRLPAAGWGHDGLKGQAR